MLKSGFVGKSLLVFLVGVSLFLVTRSWYRLKPQAESSTLVVGMMSGWAPFMALNKSGEYEGFDVDVAQELAKRMGKTLEIKDLGSLSSCFVALEQKRVDLVMSGLDITEKRLNSLRMVRYTGEDVTRFSLVFWNSIPSGVKTINDISSVPNGIVCVESGSGQEAFLDQFSSISKKGLPSVTDMLLDLKFGKSLAAVLEPRVAARLQRKNPEIKTLPIDLPLGFQVYGAGIAFRKDSQKLAQQVASLIQSMRSDGTLKSLEQKWQLEE